ncbi:unnamed protein product, partial [Rotaria sp. Silwood1]
RDDNVEKKIYYSELINFSTKFSYGELNSIWNNRKMLDWTIQKY